MPEWFEQFFTGLYAKVLGGQFDQPRSLQQARLVKRLLKLRKGARVLDVPCGTGRLTIPLARMGLVMTGVDLTAPFLQRARRYAGQQQLRIRLVHRDMRDITFEHQFDAAFNWFGSFGYFSDADNLAFCKRILQALKPGGRFLVEGINKSWLLAHFRPRSQQTIAGVRIDHAVRYDPPTSRVRATWTFRKGTITEPRRLAMWVFNGAQIRSLLRAAGFRHVQLFGNPPIGPLTRHSRRIIAVATRPAPTHAPHR